MAQFEKKELKGRMWKETEAKVIWKGSVFINGKDEYISCIKTEVSGRPKYELLGSLGLLYLKDDQSKENSPDIGGPITLKDVAYKFGGWEQMNPDTGDTSLSVGLLVADDQPQSVAKEEESSPFPSDEGDSDIPF
tara:strand:- start:332 stop:736 length:405 start_codon:yes stop_codon:yes gene_type:complete